MKKKKQVRKKKQEQKSKTAIWVGLGILAVVLLIGIFADFSTTGEAIKVGDTLTTPPLEAIDLGKIETAKLDTASLNSVKLKFPDMKDEVTVEARKNVTGTIQYKVLLGTELRAQGLLGSSVASSGPIYINSDTKADLELSVKDKILTFKKLNFEQADAADIQIYLKDWKIVDDTILFTEAKKPANYWFNVTSSLTPKVTMKLKSGTKVAVKELSKGETFSKVGTTIVPLKPDVLTVMANVSDQITSKEYIVAVGDMVYNRTVKDLPTIAIKRKADKTYDVTYSFEKTTKLQPFSLLCGKTDSKSIKNVNKIFTYTTQVGQWSKDAPPSANEINQLEAGNGYLLQLVPDKKTSFTVNCKSLESGHLPFLKGKWNLVSIVGIYSESYEDMADKAPAGKKVTKVYEFSNKGATLATVDAFEPGKVYWLKVE